MSTYRTERVGDLLLSFLAEEVRRLNDPRLQLLTLTAVEMSKDLRHARIFWSLPMLRQDEKASDSEVGTNEQEERESRKRDTTKALKGVENLLKRRIADELDLRCVPELNFRYDESADTSSRIDFLLKKAGF